MPSKIILVNKKDKEVGSEFKIKAHKEGKLHRAFSIFIFNQQGKLLLQRRALKKYHSGGLWTNTCCSHPKPGETVMSAAHRRLPEEMGFDCDLEEVFSFIYKAKLDDGLIEYEFDHVLFGNFNKKLKININPDEVEEFKWIDLESLADDIKQNPENYTYWLKECFAKIKDMHIRRQNC